ncbi:hypothetical protein AGABI2DRAFT_121538 [Agaricus bisporus var. bisporus H97]|uniref:hypothetical protein n=1 Tax=Agaricus bisporus var. bisporus (strain H97 / ATCC MYA-4626 / FGSC 10389) TaxID=936046 RepID=UPI00029F7490|nr:hypothetical protein AGABI2DRAFT_121538 [Agaricus bisporus var. bisporus H97]EKV43413.1 hypothetical protein AGABI2DRAFT_121538 [Agaricus bisporus var. bisporus H97]
MFQWLVISLSFALLFGRQEGAEPPFAFCTFQALLVHAAPVVGGMGLICYFIEFHLIISNAVCGEALPPNRWRTFCLVTSPWIVFLAIIIIDIWLVFHEGYIDDIERAPTGYYCHAKSDILVILSAAIPAVVLMVGISCQVLTGILMYRHWDAFKHLKHDARRIHVMIYLRMVSSALVIAIGIILSALAFNRPWSDDTSLIYPFMLIAIAVAFGASRDIFRAWLFWRTPKPCASIIFNHGTVVSSRISFPSQQDVIVIIGPDVEDASLASTATKSPSTKSECAIYMPPVVSQ